jgi:hypothetical protein
MTTQLARHLISVLRDPALPGALAELSNQDMADLSIALKEAREVAQYVVWVRCHPEEAQS